jgi:hypothetical protein
VHQVGFITRTLLSTLRLDKKPSQHEPHLPVSSQALRFKCVRLVHFSHY